MSVSCRVLRASWGIGLLPRLLQKKYYGSKHEPDYLDSLKPQNPVYDLLNVQLKSYDFVPLESFGKYVHRTAENMGLNVEDCWATPAQIIQVQVYKPKTSIIDKTFKLYLYERNIQISNLPCYFLSTFVEVVQNSLPEGVQLSIHPHESSYDEIRYIPDLDLLDLKGKLEEMKNPDPKKKKK